MSRLQGHGAVGRRYVTEKSSDTTGNFFKCWNVYCFSFSGTYSFLMPSLLVSGNCTWVCVFGLCAVVRVFVEVRNCCPKRCTIPVQSRTWLGGCSLGSVPGLGCAVASSLSLVPQWGRQPSRVPLVSHLSPSVRFLVGFPSCASHVVYIVD
jgi:hypothetical protein